MVDIYIRVGVGVIAGCCMFRTFGPRVYFVRLREKEGTTQGFIMTGIHPMFGPEDFDRIKKMGIVEKIIRMD